uniref:Uncharacterized protein n=1 Tax=Oryza brachyantha TaxID=4533 RepID=J3LVB0_ORYBR
MHIVKDAASAKTSDTEKWLQMEQIGSLKSHIPSGRVLWMMRIYMLVCTTVGGCFHRWS